MTRSGQCRGRLCRRRWRTERSLRQRLPALQPCRQTLAAQQDQAHGVAGKKLLALQNMAAQNFVALSPRARMGATSYHGGVWRPLFGWEDKAFSRVRGRSLTLKRDRKSTRLNSSHGYISYAVFCLKKKKRERGARCCLQLHRRVSRGTTRSSH